eukprot:CAMPEP_0168735832 /NCGR_PEP_ID=MMETSP0724-20121128/9544_1 /TAXON_ID=265536 /ORGANISM="Amphiprora sp., Strain CCMP467" /LENGTH=652 /DNA_ID=CAMNT_0008783003 /DNA_START=81 /DNA_END=2039 /DNA_ORIENTATION=+
MMITNNFCLSVALALLAQTKTALGFYVPGVAPLTFKKGEDVPLKVNALTSTRTQVPRDYYRLPFCQPDGGPKMASENLGEFLTGNKIQSSPYVLNMLTEAYCTKLCQVTLDKMQAAKLRLHIKYGYHNNWIIDNLPSAAIGVGKKGERRKRYAGGFPVGFMATDNKLPYVYNHVNINVDYNEYEGGYRVVGFAIEPLSIKHEFQGGFEWDGSSPEGLQKPLDSCSTTRHLQRGDISMSQIVKPQEKILFTYDVTWIQSEVEWSSRWDVYLSEDHLVPAQVHWYSITNSILVVVFLSFLVISILVRNLRRDIAAYNALAVIADEEDEEEKEDEKGWKLVHADVFRPPTNHPMLYCVFMGSGAQLGITLLVAICLSAVGFLSPARRGSLINSFLVFYMLSGIFAGYLSSRLYKSFRGRQWQLCTVITALLFPGVSFGTFVFFNIILFFLHSSASAPFLDVVIVAAMWCCVSIPLVFVGAYFGYKAEAIEFPTVTSTISRAIPDPPNFFMNPLVAIALAGAIPFVAAYVELFFIMTSLWMDQFYYVFGFTLIVYIIMLVTCGEVTVLLVYYQLCAENHRWWWFSFFSAGSSAFFTYVYAAFWFRQLEASRMLMTYLLYFGYMFLICFGMLLVFGTAGSLLSLWFVRKIFGTIKVD